MYTYILYFDPLLWQPFPPTAAAAASANALAGWMVNAAAASSSVQAAVVTASSLPVPPNQGDGSYLNFIAFVLRL